MADHGANADDRCPLQKAAPMQVTGYRGIKKPPVKSDDLLSFFQLGITSFEDATCQHFGVSIWVRENDARHAQRAFRFMRKWHIATIDIQLGDGYIANTPRDGDDEHHTFWIKNPNKSAATLKIAIPPLV